MDAVETFRERSEETKKENASPFDSMHGRPLTTTERWRRDPLLLRNGILLITTGMVVGVMMVLVMTLLLLLLLMMIHRCRFSQLICSGTGHCCCMGIRGPVFLCHPPLDPHHIISNGRCSALHPSRPVSINIPARSLLRNFVFCLLLLFSSSILYLLDVPFPSLLLPLLLLLLLTRSGLEKSPLDFFWNKPRCG